MSDTTFPLPVTPDHAPAAGAVRTATRLRRAVGAVVVAAVGITAFAVTAAVRADDDSLPAPLQAATEADLLEAAEWARRMEALDPEAFAVSPKPATYEDLRLAAEWARRTAASSPTGP